MASLKFLFLFANHTIYGASKTLSTSLMYGLPHPMSIWIGLVPANTIHHFISKFGQVSVEGGIIIIFGQNAFNNRRTIN